jgi:hypothetical protein
MLPCASPRITPGTVFCNTSGMEASWNLAMSDEEARPTAPGNLPIGISLPATGDMLTVPLSMPPVPGTKASTGCTGATGAGCGAGATTCFFFGVLFFCAALGAGCACFWMTSTAGSSEAAGGAGVGGATPPESCAMAGADARQTTHNTDANADAERINLTPPVVREVTNAHQVHSG